MKFADGKEREREDTKRFRFVVAEKVFDIQFITWSGGGESSFSLVWSSEDEEIESSQVLSKSGWRKLPAWLKKENVRSYLFDISTRIHVYQLSIPGWKKKT